MGIPEDPHDADAYWLDKRNQRLRIEQACDPCWQSPYDEEEEETPMSYISLAMRTNSTVTGQNTAVTPDLLHATLGLCDEHFEYHGAKSWLNACEELGDLCWFVALASHALDVNPFDGWEDYLDSTPDAPLLATAIGEFVSLVKKSYAYGRELPVARLFYLLRTMAARIARIVESKSDRSFEDLLSANIDKLVARYPEKFEVDRALNRNLISEDRALRSVLH